MDPITQLDLFNQAVAALGGTRSAARTIALSERHMIRLTQGTAALHGGILHELAMALLAHAEHCRALERQLSPMFAANLTMGQAPPAQSVHPQKAR